MDEKEVLIKLNDLIINRNGYINKSIILGAVNQYYVNDIIYSCVDGYSTYDEISDCMKDIFGKKIKITSDFICMLCDASVDSYELSKFISDNKLFGHLVCYVDSHRYIHYIYADTLYELYNKILKICKDINKKKVIIK